MSTFVQMIINETPCKCYPYPAVHAFCLREDDWIKYWNIWSMQVTSNHTVLWSCCLFYLINIAKPLADVFKALGIGDVIHQHDTHGSSVVRGGDSVEAFLACCVPKHTQRIFYLFAFTCFINMQNIHLNMKPNNKCLHFH